MRANAAVAAWRASSGEAANIRIRTGMPMWICVDPLREVDAESSAWPYRRGERRNAAEPSKMSGRSARHAFHISRRSRLCARDANARIASAGFDRCASAGPGAWSSLSRDDRQHRRDLSTWCTSLAARSPWPGNQST